MERFLFMQMSVCSFKKAAFLEIIYAFYASMAGFTRIKTQCNIYIEREKEREREYILWLCATTTMSLFYVSVL